MAKLASIVTFLGSTSLVASQDLLIAGAPKSLLLMALATVANLFSSAADIARWLNCTTACSPERRARDYNESRRWPVKTITIEVPATLAPSECGSDEAFAFELRVAAAIEWYSQGVISQRRAAELAGLDRTGFLLASAGQKWARFRSPTWN